MYLKHVELTIRKSLVMHQEPRAQDHAGAGSSQRLRNLENALRSTEEWLALHTDMPLGDWVGLSVDVFAQFLHCLVVLFKLSTIDEPGWNQEEVKRRTDVFEVLDRGCAILIAIPGALGLTDCSGPRSGLFFKAPQLLRAIKLLFQTEMQVTASQSTDAQEMDFTFGGDVTMSGDGFDVSEEFLQSLSAEPWLSDLFGPSWETGIVLGTGF